MAQEEGALRGGGARAKVDTLPKVDTLHKVEALPKVETLPKGETLHVTGRNVMLGYLDDDTRLVLSEDGAP